MQLRSRIQTREVSLFGSGARRGLPTQNSLNTMIDTTRSPFFCAGVVCVVLGLFAWLNFVGEITSGELDLLNFETLLFPVGIGLLQPNLFWKWIGRIQLFALALFSGVLLAGFLFMSQETKFLVFEFNKSGGSFSGVGIVLFLHGVFFLGILWVYFSIFGRTPNEDHALPVTYN